MRHVCSFLEARHLFFQQDFDRAILDYEASLSYLLQESSDSLSWAHAYTGLAELHNHRGDFHAAVQLYDKGVKIYKQLGKEEDLLWTHIGLANIFSRNYMFEKAREVRAIIFELGAKIDDHNALSGAFISASIDGRKMRDTLAEITNIELAITESKQKDVDQDLKFLIHAVAASSYARLGKTRETKANFAILQSLLPLVENQKRYQAYFINAEAYYHYSSNNYEKSLQLANENWKNAEASGEHEHKLMALTLLSLLHSKMGNPSKQLAALKKFQEITNEVHSAARSNQLLHYQTLYESEKSSRIIEQQESDIFLLQQQRKGQLRRGVGTILFLLMLFSLIYYYRSYRFQKKELRLREAFSKQLIHSQERERQKVSRNLHDGIGQKLLILKNKLARQKNEEDEIFVLNVLNEVRSVSRSLYPAVLKQLGITKAIKNMLQEVDANSDIFVVEQIESFDHLVDSEQSLQIFRIIQEALNNAIKYSKSPSIKVSASILNEVLTIEIRDYGIGLDPHSENGTGQGIQSMIERSKLIQADLFFSKPTKGTLIRLTL